MTDPVLNPPVAHGVPTEPGFLGVLESVSRFCLAFLMVASVFHYLTTGSPIMDARVLTPPLVHFSNLACCYAMFTFFLFVAALLARLFRTPSLLSFCRQFLIIGDLGLIFILWFDLMNLWALPTALITAVVYFGRSFFLEPPQVKTQEMAEVLLPSTWAFLKTLVVGLNDPELMVVRLITGAPMVVLYLVINPWVFGNPWLALQGVLVAGGITAGVGLAGKQFFPHRMSSAPDDEELLLEQALESERNPLCIRLPDGVSPILRAIAALTAGILFFHVFLGGEFHGAPPPTIFRPVAVDCLLALMGCLILLYNIRKYVRIDVQRREIRYYESNLLTQRTWLADASEIKGVLVTGVTHEFPFLLPKVHSQFSLALLLRNGLILPIPACERESESLYRLGRDLAQKLKVRLFLPSEHLEALPESLIRPVLELAGQSPSDGIGQTGKNVSGDREAVSKLWEAILGGLTLQAGKPFRIQANITTGRERLLFWLLTAFFTVSTGFLLWNQWAMIVANPRLVYLLLLDSTSMLVTLLYIWQWILEEQYELDLETREILFNSRFLWFKSQIPAGTLDDIESLGLKRGMFLSVWSIVARLKDGRRLFLTDFLNRKDIQKQRLEILQRLLVSRSRPVEVAADAEERPTGSENAGPGKD